MTVPTTRNPSTKSLVRILAIALITALFPGCTRAVETAKEPEEPMNTENAIFGGGCFWCVEAAFENQPGILDAESGYEGGHTENPSYEEVCSGRSGHAEVVRITFDPLKTNYNNLLELFFKVHDPTTPNRQGADVGTQYRSVIFFTTAEQQAAAETFIRELEQSGVFRSPVVTEVSPHTIFYPAEAYHQDYYARNPEAGYCAAVIRPKLRKLGIE